MTSAELIDLFKDKFSIEKEADVAAILDVSTSLLGQWRTGRTAMPTSVKFRLLDHCGYAWVRDALLFFVPQTEHERLLAADKHRMKARAELRAEKAAAKAAKGKKP